MVRSGLWVSVLVLVSPLAFTAVKPTPSTKAEFENERKHGEREGPSTLHERTRWFRDHRAGETGQIPPAARIRSWAQLEANLARGVLRGGGSTDSIERWEPLGPRPLSDQGVDYSGRVTAIAPHPSDPATIYIGSAQGGVWKTTDGGTNWSPLTDSQRSLAIGSLAVAPSAPQTIYAGTGEGNASCDSYFGAGVLKSLDGGSSWQLLAESTFTDTSVSAMVVHPTNPNILWVGNRIGYAGYLCVGAFPGNYGVRRSTDGGGSWTLQFGSAQVGGTAEISDLALDPANPNVLYSAVRFAGIWKSIDGGTNWSQLGGGLPTSSIGRIDVGIDPNNSAIVYAAYEDSSNGRHLGTFKSINGGATWSLLPGVPLSDCHYWSFDDLCAYAGGGFGQCWYDLDLEVAPNGDVWQGGIALWRSGNGGTTWSNACGIARNVHVDQHAIAFSANGTVWLGNDGGVFSSTNGGTAWSNHNADLELTQFYPGAALHPANASIVHGGSQDNGTVRGTGSSNWDQVFGGDGCANAIDEFDPDNTWYASYQFLNIVKTTDGGLTWADADDGLLDSNTGAAPFIGHFNICPGDSSQLVAGSDNVWITTDAAVSWSALGPDPLSGSGAAIRSITFDPSNCTRIYAALGDGTVHRTLDQIDWNDISTGLPGSGISDIVIDPNDPNHGLVAVGGFGVPHVFRSLDLLSPTPTWSPVDAGIPDTPANAVLIDPNNSAIYYLGTDLGVFRSTDFGGSWARIMNGHPNVAVYDLHKQSSTGALVSFTHGRGAFQLGQTCVGDGVACGNVGNTMLLNKIGATIQLSWNAVSCGDFGNYAVYGSTTPNAPFPLGWSLIDSPVPENSSVPLTTGFRFFKVVSVDDCGNRSTD